jgi:hypothetical protein
MINNMKRLIIVLLCLVGSCSVSCTKTTINPAKSESSLHTSNDTEGDSITIKIYPATQSAKGVK